MSGAETKAGELAGVRARDLLLPLALASLVAFAALRHGPRDFDDAYIGFRFARNLAAGHGLVYNLGEKVLGTSTPVWIGLMAGASRLSGSHDFPRIAFVLSFGCLAAAVVLGFSLLRSVASRLVAAALLAALFADARTLAVFASGMETPFYLFVIVLSVWLLARKRDVASLAVASLAPFVHPEAGLLFPSVAAAIWWRDRRLPLRSVVLGAIPGALMALALTLYFGSPIPQTVRAKSLVLSSDAETALSGMAESLYRPLLPVPLTVVSSLALSALVGVTAFRARAARPGAPFVALLLFAAGLLGFFTLAHPFLFEWYSPPVVLAGLLAFGAAIAASGRGLAAVWCALLLSAAAVHLAGFVPYDPSDREALYERAVRALALGPADVIAAPEIGVVGYSTEARILDTQGLVSPEVLAVRRRLHTGAKDGGVPAGVLRELAPPYLVALDRFTNSTLAEDPRALDPYREIAFYPSNRWGSRGLHVYRRTSP